MQDIRIERWAHTLVNYSLYVEAGETVAIYATPLAAPLVEAVYRELLRMGAHPLPLIDLENLEEILLQEGSDAQLTHQSPISSALAQSVDAQLSIGSRSNTRALSSIEPARIGKRRTAYRELAETRHKREQAGAFRWSTTLYPTSAYAQDANMSLREFEEFVFDVCFLNDPDPIACWKELSSQQQRLVDWLVGHAQVRIQGDGTDLALSIKERVFINSDGKRNFHDGKVVEASARVGQEYLEHMLEIDAGARYLGEFAFGNNPRVNRSTRSVLFDEKMGGTIHLALGNSYPETGGVNQSALHWDMVCDLRQSGEVWVDGTLFLKDGKIVM